MESDSLLGDNCDAPEEVLQLSEGEGCTCQENDVDEKPELCPVCSKNKQSHFCDICSKSYVSRNSLKSHKLFYHSGCLCNKLDTRGNPLTCRLCPSVKKKVSKLQNTHICGICSKAYATRKGLRSHYVSIHEGRKKPRNFDCPFCSRNFPSENGLEMHLVSHTGVKPHTCNECGKGFVSKLSLQRHFIIHEREQDDYKPHTCEMCKKVFPSKSQRNLHYRSHERPFPCDECLESFTHKSLLANHKKKFHVIAENKEKAMSWR